ncbi:multidrug effflux MFS transporter [Novosphingobium sp. TCA1]|uniref:multidrug effflux MFS transporter n=1 Tax=Novosphingobium sp. TCA1 TaxID=2682474 RepID=UPI00130C056D|nr:Bcr/CflA family drug resistance efflux transporter [Novosphingobium sp. TCA1]
MLASAAAVLHAPDMTSDTANPAPFPMRGVEFVVLMAALQALQALSIDIMLPALGEISRDLSVPDPNQRQLIVGVFLICTGLGSLFPGAIADRYGRRPVLLFATAAYVLSALACALVTSFPMMLAARAVSGLCTSALMVMPMTVIRDRFEGDRMASMQSLVSMTFMVVPMIAPMVGQGVMLVAGWRWIFGLIAVLGACVCVWTALRLPETLHPDYRQEIRPKVIAANMALTLRTREAVGYLFGVAFVQGAMFGYINSAQQLVAEHFGAGFFFPAVFGGMALVMASTNFVNSRIVQRFGARRVSQTALFGYIASSLLHFVLALNGETLWVFIPLMTFSMCMMSFIGSNFQSIAIQPFARTAGAAASIMSFVRMVMGSVLGALIGQAYDGTPRPILASMVAAGLTALIFVLYSERGKLFRRLNYPPGYYAAGKRP